MQFEYQNNNLTLKILDTSHIDKIIDFYTSNRCYFDPYEADKPDNFYTREFITNLVDAEYNSFMHRKHARYYLFCDLFPDKICGSVSFSNINKSMSSCIIGYKIDRQLWNQGYGRKMLTMALKAVVNDLHMHRIEAYIHPKNLYSLKLCRSLGFISEGTAYAYARINDRWEDHLRYVYISQT